MADSSRSSLYYNMGVIVLVVLTLLPKGVDARKESTAKGYGSITKHLEHVKHDRV